MGYTHEERILTALLAVCLVIALGTVGAFADGEAVATIGAEEYPTLSAAIDAAELSTEDVVINLLANVSDTINISKNEGSITIDLRWKKQ